MKRILIASDPILYNALQGKFQRTSVSLIELRWSISEQGLIAEIGPNEVLIIDQMFFNDPEATIRLISRLLSTFPLLVIIAIDSCSESHDRSSLKIVGRNHVFASKDIDSEQMADEIYRTLFEIDVSEQPYQC